MKCPECGRQAKGANHNKRGRRCEWCWERLPDEPPKLKRRRKLKDTGGE